MAQSVQVKKINWWHDAIINWMLANPDKQLADCARQFNVSRSWLSIIINSDVFKAELEIRKGDLGTILSQDIVVKLTSVAEGSLEELDRRITHDSASIPTRDLNNVAHSALEVLGYGSPKSPANVNNFQVVVVNAEQLAAARARIGAKAPAQIDAQVSDRARLDVPSGTYPALEHDGGPVPSEGEVKVPCPPLASPNTSPTTEAALIPIDPRDEPPPQFSERPRTLEDLD